MLGGTGSVVVALVHYSTNKEITCFYGLEIYRWVRLA